MASPKARQHAFCTLYEYNGYPLQGTKQQHHRVAKSPLPVLALGCLAGPTSDLLR